MRAILYWLTTSALFVIAFGQPSVLAHARIQAPPPVVLKPLLLSSDEEALFKRMTLEQKIGQMFLIGFMGQTADQGLTHIISEVRPGGLILFSRNIHAAPQVVSLVMDAQKAAYKASNVPLLVGVDQEGGNVIRIKTSLPLPSALAFGEAGERTIVETAGEATGNLLKILGINMNFAPVLDVNDPTKPSFIGTRTYGSEPQLVSEMGVSFSKGLSRSGVMPTGKHFPGHGGIDSDSHKGTPQKNMSLADMKRTDLVPFFEMKRQFGDGWAVMLGHVAYPQIDATGMPATFSKPIVTGLLREQIGFNGLIITDDIEMAGAARIKDVGERALSAIDAGADMVMIAWNKRLQRSLSLALQKAARTGRLPIARINESVKRILIAKRQVAKPRTTPPTNAELKLALKNPKFTEVAERAMAIRFNRAPVAKEVAFRDYANGKTLFVFSGNARFSELFRRALPGRKLQFYTLDAERPDLIDRAMRANPGSAGVFYVSGQEAAKVVNQISDDVRRRMLVVSVETSGALKNADQFGSFADVYYRHPALGRLIAEHYFGEVRVPASVKAGAGYPASEQTAPAKRTVR